MAFPTYEGYKIALFTMFKHQQPTPGITIPGITIPGIAIPGIAILGAILFRT